MAIDNYLQVLYHRAMNKTKMVYVRLQELDYEYLKKAAAKEQRPVSQLLTIWIKKQLDNYYKKLK